jgi:hypothetical protein
MGVKNDRFLSILRHRKSRRFGVFLVHFFTFLSILGSIGIYRKTAPTKSTVLGPGPPPWRKVDFYWFLSIFTDFGAFNRAGKSVTKIGIYALPPQKWSFYSHFIEILPFFYNYRFLTILDSICFALKWNWVAINFLHRLSFFDTLLSYCFLEVLLTHLYNSQNQQNQKYFKNRKTISATIPKPP